MVELRCRSEVTTGMSRCSAAEDRIGVFCTNCNHGAGSRHERINGDAACDADCRVSLTEDNRLTTIESSFIHSFIYFDSGGMAHKNNRQITIDNTRKYRKTDRHIVDK